MTADLSSLTIPDLLDVQPLTHAMSTSGTTPLESARLLRAKHAYTTRFLAQGMGGHTFDLVHGPTVQPRRGDLVLACVREIGSHRRLESGASRRQWMFADDEIVVAYGDRYAPDQFEAEVPESLEPANLVAAGGLAGRVTAQHDRISDATVIEPLGLIRRDGQVLNLLDLAPYRVAATPPVPQPGGPRLVAVLGSSMNSGKSTALAYLIRGLTRAGLSVAAGKATGTGAGGDPGMFKDAGAQLVLDFTDFGYPSTFRLNYDELKGLVISVMATLSSSGADVVVVEIADGLYQGDTARLIADPLVQTWIDSLLFAAADALGAAKGVELLQQLGLQPAAVSGVLTASPLASREADAATDAELIETAQLSVPRVAESIMMRDTR